MGEEEVKQHLLDMPVQKWQCADGCKYLQAAERINGVQRYRCAYWDGVLAVPTLTANPRASTWLIGPKHIAGPFDEAMGTRQCGHFQQDFGATQ